ncbi:MAG: VgrG-related protein [Solirubrobacteraceae bacterium]
MPAKQPTAGLEIKVDGAKIDAKWMDALLDVQVRDNLMLPDTALVRLRDPKGENIDSHPLKAAARLEILLSAAEEQTVKTVFDGEIVALEPEFLEGDCILAARAYDKGHRLNRHRRSRTFQNQTASDMVKTVAQAAGLALGTVESTGGAHEFFQQSMETDWDFCWRLAAMNDFEFLVEGTKFHFRKRKRSGVAATLKWGEGLLTFKPRMSAAGQVQDVTVTNHDPKTRQAITGRATSPALAYSSPAAGQRNGLIGKLSGGSVVVADRVVTSTSEATDVAQSLLDRLSSSFIEADGTAFGDPAIAAGATVKLEGVGSFSGEYVLAQTTHLLTGGRGYTTAFSISGRSARTIGDLVQRGNGTRNWGNALVIGVVTNNNDPEGMGRVRVKFEALGSTMEGWWARVATLNAGNERGVFMMPQPNDEVVVGFEHGDPRRPFVLGSLYNGKAKLPGALKDPQERKSLYGVKTDHEVLVDGKQQMTLRTGEKMTVEVNRNGQGGTGDYLLDAKGNIEEKAAQGVKVTAGQTIELTGNQSVTIKGTGSVTVESSGQLDLKGASVNVQATGPLTLKGAIINIG